MTGMLTRLKHSRRGVSLVEFALIAPVVCLLLMGGFDIGNAIQQSLQLEAAARAGAQYAFSRPTDTVGITAAIRANLLGWSDITVPSPVTTCRCDNGVTVSCNGGVCATGTPAMYLSVRVSRPFSASTPLAAAALPAQILVGDVELRLR
ncbi:pilus assembly protein [Pseudoroseomonas wenyumeiae]|uniref:Pilus assembly protein n=1 Tax=Teichococcus wenyumeiae TaxID=2478470 RepID=A0A3A9JVY7_9PROT|nr:TadE/TadG family type IV pilus assembly protein [Pseudoroseomonas wenyumeiae]RKK03189.1 pilus assembly protein [Pseudoroseomonas wenyumeiae]RMI15556.1 pilus assembly protein [Pseudoroseomonas wenyumeiae]